MSMVMASLAVAVDVAFSSSMSLTYVQVADELLLPMFRGENDDDIRVHAIDEAREREFVCFCFHLVAVPSSSMSVRHHSIIAVADSCQASKARVERWDA